MTASGCVSSCVTQSFAPLFASTAIRSPPFCEPTNTELPSTTGPVRETEPAIPLYSAIWCCHTTLPLAALKRKRLPPHSGTYTAFPSTAGVAETLPPVLATHLGTSCAAVAVLITRSAGWFRVFERFWPLIGQLGPAPATSGTTAAQVSAATTASSRRLIRHVMIVLRLSIRPHCAIPTFVCLTPRVNTRRKEQRRHPVRRGSRRYARQRARGFRSATPVRDWESILVPG